MAPLKRVLSWLDVHLEEALLIVILVVISCVSLLQVIIRNIPWIPALKWAEEFCRFCWIWSVFLSIPYTIRRECMLRVSALLDVLPKKAHKPINLFADSVTLAVMLLMCVYSVPAIERVMRSGETSPAMLWPMWIVYTVVFAGFFLATIRSIQMLILHARRNDGSEEDGLVQQPGRWKRKAKKGVSL